MWEKEGEFGIGLDVARVAVVVQRIDIVTSRRGGNARRISVRGKAFLRWEKVQYTAVGELSGDAML